MNLPSYEDRLRSLLHLIGEHTTCKGCGATIFFVHHRNGKYVPYDSDGESVGVNHFVTCPKASQFGQRAAEHNRA